MGTHDINNYSSTYQKIRSKAWVYHENYTGGTEADIGVILLERDILYNDDVHQAILYNGNDIFADKGVTGCGWGYHNTSNTASTILYCMDAVTITNARCGSFYGGPVRSNFICAQGKNHSRTCTGDSGSALVFKENYKSSYIVIGVLSFGPGSCIEGPVVYNRVPTYYDWIVNKIQNLSTYY
ncbi:hypothetical protein RI129_002541 [Pyrocoelia pectoralis]|uniref:Peptidase S1 domain-containing protein n=1 Tax=Pyrocoelia pectoralis TaxID=417401 RepID=A0AAN7VJ29_9COLE